MGALCGKSAQTTQTLDQEETRTEPAVVLEDQVTYTQQPKQLLLSELVDNRLAVADHEACTWLNALVGTLWPRISRAVEHLVDEQVEPLVRGKLPNFLQGAFTLTADIGDTQPNIGPVHVFKNTHPHLNDGPKLMVELQYCPDIKIKLKLGPLSAGVTLKKFKGALMVSLNPVTDHMPVVNGITTYFPDVPRFDLDFTGIANIADAPGIARVVRSALEGAVANQMVLPKKQVMHWAEGGEKHNQSGEMLPLGMLRVKVISCTGFPTDADSFPFVGKLKIEPYVRLRLGDNVFDCDIAQATGEPQDPAKTEVEFALFDTMQKLCIGVYDADNFTCDDHIAHHEPLRIIDAIKATKSPLKLTKPTAPDVGAGELKLELEWLSSLPKLQGSEGCLVMVTSREVFIPAEWNLSSVASIRVRVGKEEKTAPATSKKEDKRQVAAIDRALADVKKRLLDQGVPQSTCEKAVKKEGEQTNVTLAEINFDFWFKVHQCSLQGVVDLCLLSKDGDEVGSTTVSFKDLKAAEGLHLPGPFWLSRAGSKEQAMADIEVRVCGLFPEKAG